MNEYNIITNPIHLFAGTMNTTSPVYTEAAKTLENKSAKSIGYIKNFMTSIEKVCSSGKNDQISKSKGNISVFSGYKNIKVGLEFLTTNVSGEKIVPDLKNILKALEVNQTRYSDAYEKNIQVIILEYEASLYMLVTGISFAMANYTDIQKNGTQVKIVKKAGRDKGIITKIVHELGKELLTNDHRKYLEELIKAKDEVKVSTKLESFSFNESVAGETIDLVKALWDGTKSAVKLTSSIAKTIYRTMFGILPLIRSALYLRYKRKADTIISLEEQIQFIEMNIDQLKNIKSIDETKKAEIIKKQEAVIEAYRKKSEKLRAELTEAEMDAANALKADESEIKKDSSDDFILD